MFVKKSVSISLCIEKFSVKFSARNLLPKCCLSVYLHVYMSGSLEHKILDGFFHIRNSRVYV
jgi:hypothetical protein